MPAVTIYTTSYCSFCARAKQVLRKEHVQFTEVDVTDDPAKRRWLTDTTGQRTVPQIFIGEQAIGGCTDLEALVRKGGLAPLLAG